MIRALDPAANYRAVYLTLWRMNERHECAVHAQAANDLGSDVSERAWPMPGGGDGGTSHDQSDSRGGL
jgi:hypothetical protein